MRVIVRSTGVNFWLPIPLFLASAAVHLIPESAIAELRSSVPPPYQDMVTKELLVELVRECRDILKQYKGLEMIHVEARDGTFVSIRL